MVYIDVSVQGGEGGDFKDHYFSDAASDQVTAPDSRKALFLCVGVLEIELGLVAEKEQV